MPNWVENSLEIRTNHPVLSDMLIAFSKRTIGDHNDFFESLVPIGEWDYDKACATWGVKWDANDFVLSDLSEENGMISFCCSFNTAWGQPELFIDHLLRTFNSDQFETEIENKWLEEQGFYGVYFGGGSSDEVVNIYDLYAVKNEEALREIDECFSIYDNGWFEGLDEEEDEGDDEE